MKIIKKITYKEFKEREEAHSKGKLFNQCKKCGVFFKPEIRKYKNKNYNPELFQKYRMNRYKEKYKIVGNWIQSYCNNCLKILSKEREIYKKKIKEEQLKRVNNFMDKAIEITNNKGA